MNLDSCICFDGVSIILGMLGRMRGYIYKEAWLCMLDWPSSSDL